MATTDAPPCNVPWKVSESSVPFPASKLYCTSGSGNVAGSSSTISTSVTSSRKIRSDQAGMSTVNRCPATSSVDSRGTTLRGLSSEFSSLLLPLVSSTMLPPVTEALARLTVTACASACGLTSLT